MYRRTDEVWFYLSFKGLYQQTPCFLFNEQKRALS